MKLTQKDRNRLIIPLRVAYALTITQIDDFKTYILHVTYTLTVTQNDKNERFDYECNSLTKYSNMAYLNKTKLNHKRILLSSLSSFLLN